MEHHDDVSLEFHPRTSNCGEPQHATGAETTNQLLVELSPSRSLSDEHRQTRLECCPASGSDS